MWPMQKADRSVEYVVWCVIRLNNTATPVCIEIHLGRTLSYNEHNTKDKTTKCPQHHHRQACKFEVDTFTNANTNSMLSRPLLFFCRILLSCSGNDYPFKRVQTGHTWQVLRHHSMSHASIHQLAGIAPARITRTVASRIERERQIDINQQPILQPCTICQQTRIDAQWHQSNHRLNTPDCVCNIQLPTATSCQNGIRNSWIPTSKVWPTAPLLAFVERFAYWDWPCKDNEEEVRSIDWWGNNTMHRIIADNTQSVNCESGEPLAMINFFCWGLLDKLITRAGKAVCPEVAPCCVNDRSGP